MQTRQMTQFFIYFFQSVTFIFIFENCRNSFSCGLPFGPLWSVKYLNFGQKLPISKVHHNFLESRHLEVTKNPNYSLSPEGSPKKVTAHATIYFATIKRIGFYEPCGFKSSWKSRRWMRRDLIYTMRYV